MESVNPILGAAAVLGLWSVLMFFIYAVRLMGTGAKVGELPAGFGEPDAEAETPNKVKWTRHNYEHLMEQPTVFYAMVIILAMAGDTSAASCYAAWTPSRSRAFSTAYGKCRSTRSPFALRCLQSHALHFLLAVHAVMFTVQL